MILIDNMSYISDNIRLVIEETQDEDTGKTQYYPKIQEVQWTTIFPKEGDTFNAFNSKKEALKEGEIILQKKGFLSNK